MVYRVISISIALFSLMTLSACGKTSLLVKPANESVNHGVVYYLPKADYEIALKYQLKSCDGDLATVKISPTLTTYYTQDQSHVYVIDYDDLSSGSKTTKANITLYENGTLHGINANAEDKTASILSGSINALGKIALLSAGVPFVKGKPVLICTDDAIAALKNHKVLTKTIEGLDKQIADLQAELERWQNRAKVTVENEQTIEKLRKKLQKLSGERKAGVKKMEVLVKYLTQAEVYTFTPEGGLTEQEFKPSPDLVKKWFTVADSTQLTVYSHLYTGAGNVSSADVSDEGGIVYRQPATGQLMLCQATPCMADGNIIVESQKRLLTANVQVPQLGWLSRLSFENGIYQNNKVMVSFNQAGGLTSFDQEDFSSRIEGVVGTVNEAVDAYSGYVDKLNAYKETQALKEADKAAVNDVIVANDKAAEELASEAKRINAQIELIEAQKKLDALTAGE